MRTEGRSKVPSQDGRPGPVDSAGAHLPLVPECAIRAPHKQFDEILAVKSVKHAWHRRQRQSWAERRPCTPLLASARRCCGHLMFVPQRAVESSCKNVQPTLCIEHWLRP